MLANFLEKSKPINFITYLGFFLIFFLLEVYTTFFLKSFSFNEVVTSISFFSFFLVIFFFVNFILTKNNLTFDNTFAYFLFILFVSILIGTILNYQSLLCVLLYFLFLRKVYSLQKSSNFIQKLFDAGLWLGVLVFFQPKTILFLLVVFTAILVYDRINIKNILIPLIGFFIPLFLGFTYFLYVDKSFVFFQVFSGIQLNITQFKSIENSWFIIFIIVLSSLAFLLKTPKAMAISNTFRKSWLLININYFIAFVLVLISNPSNKLSVVFLIFPAAIIVANGLELIRKKTLQSIVFGIIILFTVFGKFLF